MIRLHNAGFLRVVARLLLIFTLCVIPLQEAGLLASDQPVLLDKDQLELDKLRQEIRKLELENERLNSASSLFLAWAPFVTALVALIGAGLTIWKHIDETSQRQKIEIHQREQETLRRFSESFAATAKNLGDDSPAIQAAAASSLMSFLKPQYREFSEDVFLLLLASLKVSREQSVADILVRVFEKALPLELEQLARPGGSAGQRDTDRANLPLDLARTYLYRVDLGGLDFQAFDLDIAYANLKGANLSDCSFHRLKAFGAELRKARLARANLLEAGLNSIDAREASFHNANLVSAKLKNARLNNAEFHQARMQEAHLEGAHLEGAHFEEANLNNTYFRRAFFDLSAKRSITRALNWEKANFDDGVYEELLHLAKN